MVYLAGEIARYCGSKFSLFLGLCVFILVSVQTDFLFEVFVVVCLFVLTFFPSFFFELVK